jgi:hypothetical protein
LWYDVDKIEQGTTRKGSEMSEIKTVKSQAEFVAIRDTFVVTEKLNPRTGKWEVFDQAAIDRIAAKPSQGMPIPPRGSK